MVAAGDLVAGSSYVADGRQPGIPLDRESAEWRNAADLAARLVAPDPVFVLDVCEVPTGLRLLELNPFSGADLYGCDRAAVVAAVERLAG